MTARMAWATLALANCIFATMLRAAPAVGQDTVPGGVPLTLASPRVPPVPEAELTAEQRELLAPLFRERGSVPNLYRTLVRHPKMFMPRYNFGHYIKSESTLPARDREILICRVAWLTSSEYEWSAHTAIGRQAGLSADDIRRIAAGPNAGGWQANDLATMRAADELFNDMFVKDATWQALSTRLNMYQMMDAVMTVGTYQTLAGLLRSCGVPLEANATRFAASRATSWGAPTPARPTVKPATAIRLNTPRIAPTPEKDWTETDRELLSSFKRDRGYVPNVYATLSRHPEMYRLWLVFARYILRESTLPAREREMLILRIAYLTGGEYEWAAHSRLGQEAGLTADEVARIGREPLSGWNDADQAVLVSVSELHNDSFLSDGTWTKLSSRFNTQQMMDLVLTVGAYKMLAMALNSLGAQLDQGMVGFAGLNK